MEPEVYSYTDETGYEGNPGLHGDLHGADYRGGVQGDAHLAATDELLGR